MAGDRHTNYQRHQWPTSKSSARTALARVARCQHVTEIRCRVVVVRCRDGQWLEDWSEETQGVARKVLLHVARKGSPRRVIGALEVMLATPADQPLHTKTRSPWQKKRELEEGATVKAGILAEDERHKAQTRPGDRSRCSERGLLDPL
jgi:hypothetical protein